MEFHFDIHVDERAKLGIFKINHIAQKHACNWNPWIQLADGIVLLQWWWLWKNFHAWPLNKSPCNAITKLSPEQKKSLALFFQRRISMLNWFLRRIRFSIPTGRLELFMLSMEFVMVYSFLWFCCGFDFRLIVKCLLYFTYRRQIWCRNITLPEKSGNIFCKRKFFRIHH